MPQLGRRDAVEGPQSNLLFSVRVHKLGKWDAVAGPESKLLFALFVLCFPRASVVNGMSGTELVSSAGVYVLRSLNQSRLCARVKAMLESKPCSSQNCAQVKTVLKSKLWVASRLMRVDCSRAQASTER